MASWYLAWPTAHDVLPVDILLELASFRSDLPEMMLPAGFLVSIIRHTQQHVTGTHGLWFQEEERAAERRGVCCSISQ